MSPNELELTADSLRINRDAISTGPTMTLGNHQVNRSEGLTSIGRKRPKPDKPLKSKTSQERKCCSNSPEPSAGSMKKKLCRGTEEPLYYSEDEVDWSLGTDDEIKHEIDSPVKSSPQEDRHEPATSLPGRPLAVEQTSTLHINNFARPLQPNQLQRHVPSLLDDFKDAEGINTAALPQNIYPPQLPCRAPTVGLSEDSNTTTLPHESEASTIMDPTSSQKLDPPFPSTSTLPKIFFLPLPTSLATQRLNALDSATSRTWNARVDQERHFSSNPSPYGNSPSHHADVSHGGDPRYGQGRYHRRRQRWRANASHARFGAREGDGGRNTRDGGGGGRDVLRRYTFEDDTGGSRVVDGGAEYGGGGAFKGFAGWR
ncbi:Hypothetical protein D9617_7g031700 [Elsinoe fawcettii]|nr:Hypothetical protein D9617_7g031700 [Elsinoe fawcettii]